MKFKILDFALSPKQLEYLLDQYNREIIKKKHEITFFPIQMDQINIWLTQTDFKFCKNITPDSNGVHSILNTNYRLALQSGSDYKLFYTILTDSFEEDQDHWPLLIGYENKNGIFWNIEAVY